MAAIEWFEAAVDEETLPSGSGPLLAEPAMPTVATPPLAAPAPAPATEWWNSGPVLEPRPQLDAPAAAKPVPAPTPAPLIQPAARSAPTAPFAGAAPQRPPTSSLANAFGVTTQLYSRDSMDPNSVDLDAALAGSTVEAAQPLTPDGFQPRVRPALSLDRPLPQPDWWDEAIVPAFALAERR